jgi:hypothetical protein
MATLTKYSQTLGNSLKHQLETIRGQRNLLLQIFILEHTFSNFLFPLLLLDNAEAYRSIFYFVCNCIAVQCIYAVTGISKAMMLPFLSSIFQILSIITFPWRAYNVDHYSAFFIPRMTFPRLFMMWHHYIIVEHTVIMCMIGSALLRYAGITISDNKAQVTLTLPTENEAARSYSVVLTSTFLPGEFVKLHASEEEGKHQTHRKQDLDLPEKSTKEHQQNPSKSEFPRNSEELREHAKKLSKNLDTQTHQHAG